MQSPLPPAHLLNISFLMHAEIKCKAYILKAFRCFNELILIQSDAI
jgi:hypothetical protein